MLKSTNIVINDNRYILVIYNYNMVYRELNFLSNNIFFARIQSENCAPSPKNAIFSELFSACFCGFYFHKTLLINAIYFILFNSKNQIIILLFHYRRSSFMI
jgi:hypothetical protein